MAAGEGRRGRTHESASPRGGERINVEWSFLKPSGVAGNKNERAETDLSALSQSAGGNHDDENRKKLQLLQ